MMRSFFCKTFLAAIVLGLFSAQASAQCTGVNHVQWPTVDPVWDFCWKRPSASSLPDGEGIEITNVKYKGELILKRGHIPVINVKYVSGASCSCFRDWLDAEIRFECSPVPSTGYCTGTTLPARTVCQNPGSDIGSFTGVSVEDKGDFLKLMSQTSAGWYRYIPVWEFYLDGTIRARMDAAATSNSCVRNTHRHHVYWRLDFDVKDPNNVVTYSPSISDPFSRVTNETVYTDHGDDRSRWRVGHPDTTTVVQVERHEGDETADPADAQAAGTFISGDFPSADGWLLAYSASEIEDHGSSCGINLANYVNNQSVENRDVVVWVRASNYHEGEGTTTSQECYMFGPVIRVLENGGVPTTTPTVDPSASPTHTPTATPTETPTVTATFTRTPTETKTFTPSRTPSQTNTPAPSNTATPTDTPLLPTATPTLGQDGPLLVSPVYEGQTQFHVFRVFPPGNTVDLLSMTNARSRVLASGTSDVFGEAHLTSIEPLQAGEHIAALNREANSMGPEEVAQGLPASPTVTHSPTAQPSETSVPATISSPPPQSSVGILLLLAVLIGSLHLGRRIRNLQG